MLGNYQQSQLRIEVSASKSAIADALLKPANLRQWYWFARLESGLPEQFTPGLTYTGYLGPIALHYVVDIASETCLRSQLSGAIDGYHEWSWGENWVQSRLEGITALPLNFGQTLGLISLRTYLQRQEAAHPTQSP
ncbi:MAG: hypothetical protein AAGG02_08210 [Cyanobacteria bacterium P01_H01_bin.15]